MQTLKSPITGKPLSPVNLTEGLQALQCADSGGHYIPAVCYMTWLEKQEARLPQLPESSAPLESEMDPSSVRICPESGTLMTRYKVGHGFAFTIDRSITGGIWRHLARWRRVGSPAPTEFPR